MSKIALLSAAAFGALTLVPAAANAQCTPANPAAGQTVTCAANDTDGFVDSSNNVTVNINAGVTVSAGAGVDAVRVNGLANIVNNSGVLNGGDEGVDMRGAGGVINNFAGASITGADRGVDADGIATITIDNAGAITGTGSDGVRVGNGAIITNRSTGVITGADDGLQVGSNVGIVNDGMILAPVAQDPLAGSSEGITGGANVTLTNTGTLKASDDAFQTGANATINNSGLIESSFNDGVDIDTGSITNSGIIRSLAGGEDGVDFDPTAAADVAVLSFVTNNFGALIEGEIGVNVDPSNISSQVVTNNGVIRGRGGYSLFLGEGADLVTVLEDGVFDGVADLGGGNDVLNLTAIQMALVGGGALFAGGEGQDSIEFNILTSNLIGLVFAESLAPGAFLLSFFNADGSTSTAALQSFERFNFLNASINFNELTALTTPIPGAALLFGGGLALLGWARRKSRV